MTDIRVSDSLWTTAMMPEGTIEKWLVTDGARVDKGHAVCVVRVEDALHDINRSRCRRTPRAGRVARAN
jgi:hypothetical protein